MSEFNKSYRIRTNVGGDKNIHVKLDRNYDTLEIMSLKINQENAYKLHSSNYGVVTGRVIANGGFGVPNAKISIFINIDNNDINDVVKSVLYPYNTTLSRNNDDIRYNLLPNEQVSDCHTIIGTFPEKQYALDNDDILEVFEKYYKYTTRTNNSGDYMIFGVPTGAQTIHMDLDLSDIGILSQKPRDMVYKGYHASQFENPNKFKHDTNIDNLIQVISQDTIVDVIPFWGERNEGKIGISRCDINVQYKFEPTCVFMGSVVTDNKSNGISKKCIPTPQMGAMDEITTGSGTIEMIRKTPDGNVEEFQIMGTQLINGDGVWCYQIPMNLDYMMTDEFGNMVPTNDPNKGIPTRTKVRFRFSMQESDNNTTNFFHGKVLVPHNPDVYGDNCEDKLDYQFGSLTKENSFKDLFWNGIYSVKSYIPRIQKGNNWRSEKFTGFKKVNYYNDKNPIPYNNIRIKLSFIFTIVCFLFKMYIKFVGFTNRIYRIIGGLLVKRDDDDNNTIAAFLSLSGEMCNDDLDYLCIIPGIDIQRIATRGFPKRKGLLAMAISYHFNEMGSGEIPIPGEYTEDQTTIQDNKSIDNTNKEENECNYLGSCDGWDHCIRGIRVTDKTDYLIQCMEIKLAEEYRVIKFDFYNDWINGLIYIPRWVRIVKNKRTFLWGLITRPAKIKACNEDFKRKRNLVQQCALDYDKNGYNVVNRLGCHKKLRCHKSKEVRKKINIFKQGGLIRTQLTSKGQNVYYFKPCENTDGKNIRLFATDIILLGTLNDCDKWGIANNLTELSSTTYQMPPNLALTDNYGDSAEYTSGLNPNKKIKMNFGKSKGKGGKYIRAELNISECYTGVDVVEDDGAYTELAGVDWGYAGPLQTDNLINGFNGIDPFYRAGGHFLGISCRNAETTIKSCVNLSRVCELGVWMSQRQELNIPSNQEVGEFFDYATVPSGLISKDEISDSSYRIAFASMNQNGLKTITNPDTLYPVYDFYFLTPNNFAGELSNHVHNTNNGNYNRFITNAVIEREYEFNDDDNFGNDFRVEVSNETINETQIMRTGEYRDKEYIKFRFGGDTNMDKRYLLNNQDTYSMPLYNNSYYFYFGLHEGKTALDKFKEEYYAVCQKSNDLVQSSNSIVLKDLKIVYDGVCTNTYKGSIEFKIKTEIEKINEISVELIGSTYHNEISDAIKNNIIEHGLGNRSFNFNELESDDYIIKITINGIEQSFNVTVDSISVSAELNSVGFIKKINNTNTVNNFTNTRIGNNNIGGYITIKDNKIKYIKGVNEDEYINLFENNKSKIEISFIYNNITYTIEEDNSRNVFVLKSGGNVIEGCEVEKISDLNNNIIIPVPFENITYSVYVTLPLTDCKVNMNGDVSNTYSFLLGSVTINKAREMSLYYNELSYDDYFDGNWDQSRFIETTNGKKEYWWWEFFEPSNEDTEEENEEQFDEVSIWKIKEVLYQTKIGDDITHNVKISRAGGVPPIDEILENVGITKMQKGDTIETNLVYAKITKEEDKNLSNIKLPTLNYKGSNYEAYALQYKDSNGQTYPESKKFIFPIVYKPFFMEMGMWYFENNDKYYLYGNVYNGKTWDYKNYGYNNVLLNDVPIANFVQIKHPDNWMEIDEPHITTDKGGYYYKGNYCKYNGRKTTVNREIESNVYGIYANESNRFGLDIGCRHEKDGIIIKDNTSFFDNNLRLFTFEFEGEIINGSYHVRMELYNIPEEVKNDYKIYLIQTDNSSTSSSYGYPLNNGKFNPDPKLFYDILTNNVIEFKSNTVSYRGKNDWINLSDDNLNDKNLFYVAVNKEKPEEDLNKVRFISVSNLINIGILNMFYPLNIELKIDIKDKKLSITPNNTDGSSTNFKNKKLELHFYKTKSGDEKIELLKLEKNTGENDALEVDLTQYMDDLELTKSPLPTPTSLHCSYYVYSGETKSPTIYNVENITINSN